jgi:hypothetical protein
MWFLLALAGVMSLTCGIHEMLQKATVDKVAGFILSLCGMILTCIAAVILILIGGHH